VDKASLIARHRQALAERAASLRSMRDAARSGMRVDEGHRPTNRGERAAVTSQGYLAAGFQSRLDALEADLGALDRLDGGPRDRLVVGALARIADEDGRERLYLLLPGGQGDPIDSPAGPVTVVSPQAPVARSLLGLEEGDSAETVLAGREAELEIVELS